MTELAVGSDRPGPVTLVAASLINGFEVAHEISRLSIAVGKIRGVVRGLVEHVAGLAAVVGLSLIHI